MPLCSSPRPASALCSGCRAFSVASLLRLVEPLSELPSRSASRRSEIVFWFSGLLAMLILMARNNLLLPQEFPELRSELRVFRRTQLVPDLLCMFHSEDGRVLPG